MSQGEMLDQPRQVLVHSPITALAIYRSHAGVDGRLYVLAGEDAWLKVYDATPEEDDDDDHHHHRPRGQLRGQLRVFAAQPIHGIAVSSSADGPTTTTSSDGDLLIWGAQSVAVVSAAEVEQLTSGRCGDVRRPVEARASDWIYDGQLSPYGGRGSRRRGVLVTAHNEVVPFTAVVRRGGSEVRFGEPVFGARPVLYSTAVRWTAADRVLVVAGTVFGEIVVWRCYVGDGEDDPRARAPPPPPPPPEVLFVFTGHEGSVFGVAISPEVEVVPGRRQRLLASCSDDRTIRVWDITEEGEETAVVAAAAAAGTRGLEEVRETGFGENQHNSEARGAADSAARCLAVVMGHASRIWHVRFACRDAGSPGPVEVCSFGEDATVQRWRLNCADGDGITPGPPKTAQSYPYTLTLAEKIACHDGKHIWACAVTPDGSGRIWTVTGGADGKVTLLRDRGGAGPEHTRNILLSPDDVLGASNSDVVSPKAGGDRFLRYAFLSEDHLLVSTHTGRILLGDLRDVPTWVEVDAGGATQQDLKSYNVVKAVAPGTAVVGSASGRLYLFREAQGLEEMARLPGKIADVLCLPDGHDDTSDARTKPRILVTVLGSPQATILTLDLTEPRVAIEQSQLALDAGFLVTSVGTCGDLVVLGSRKGAIAVYRETASGHYVHQTVRNDCKTKGGDAVTSITTLPPLRGAEPKYFLTTCRDGTYRIYEAVQPSSSSSSSGSDGLSLQLRHETTPPLGPMLEGARLARSPRQGDRRRRGGGLELILYGFRGTRFVVWNETRQREAASVACGGAHRTFDYFAGAGDRLRFVYTKASAMAVFAQDRAPARVVRPGGHGREIRAVAAAAAEDGGAGPRYVATGAEDTCVRIWEWDGARDDGKRCSEEDVGMAAAAAAADLRCLAVLQKHTAGLQALRWQPGGYLLSSAGAEEFFVWKVTSLESEYRGLAVVCEAVFPFRTPDADLRIMDFDASSSPPRARDPSAAAAAAAGMQVTMAFSNSVLRTYEYTREGGFRCLQRGKYTGACLTQVRHLPRAGGGAGPPGLVITGSTDGVVTVWRPTAAESGRDEEGYAIVLTARAHGNAVKSLDVVPALRGSDGWRVYTGGDDNALSVLALAAGVDDGATAQWEKFGCARARDAHAAAITGLKVLRVDEAYSYLATVSNDQRLKIWRVERAASKDRPPRVTLLHDSYSALADPGGLELIDRGKLMVAGVGMEIWHISA